MTIRKQVRIGVLGCANVTQYALIEPLADVPELTIAAVASRNAATASTYAEQHGIPKSFGSYADLLADPDIDLVYVPLPNSLHREWTIRALEAGKTVLCEKPLAANAREAQEMVDAANAGAGLLIEAVHYRYHPVAARILAIARSGQLGRLRHIEARFAIPRAVVEALDTNRIRRTRDLGGGAAMDTGSYCVNLLRMVAGDEPVVESAVATLECEGVDATMDARLLFPGGCEARCFASLVHPGESWDIALRVVGEAGILQVSNPFVPHWGHSIDIEYGDGRHEQQQLDLTSTYVCQARAVARMMLTREAPLTTAADGVGTMKIIDAIYRAAGLEPRGTHGS